MKKGVKNKKNRVKVSVRLQQSLWAIALLLSLLVTQSQLAVGQIHFSLGDQDASVSQQATPPVAQQQASADNLVEAHSALLKARQALAHSDVDTAQSMLNVAKQQAADFSQIGDSPETIQSMIVLLSPLLLTL